MAQVALESSRCGDHVVESIPVTMLIDNKKNDNKRLSNSGGGGGSGGGNSLTTSQNNSNNNKNNNNNTHINYNTKKIDHNIGLEFSDNDPLLFGQLNQAVAIPAIAHSPHFQHHLSSNSISYYGPQQPQIPLQPQLHAQPPPDPIVETWKTDLLHDGEDKIKSLDVKCERSRMRVHIEFSRPFNGIVFSKGHFRNRNCIHIEEHSAITSKTFEISTHSCGTINNLETLNHHYKGYDSNNYFENIIIVQFDPQVQQKTDQARKLRCTWHDHYEKEITFQPLAIDTLDVIQTDFSGDNVGCWMQIQKGEGPWAREASGLVKIGQMMTMVLAIKDTEHKFDMLVRNCVAHDGKRKPITLVDEYGCVVRPKIMSNFQKMKNVEKSATVLSFAKFYAFKFPDSMEVHFQCTIQICRNQCPNQCYKQEMSVPSLPALPVHPPQYDSLPVVSNFYHRRRTSGSNMDAIPRDQRKLRTYRRYSRAIREPHSAAIEFNQTKKIGLDSIIQVVSNDDLAISLLNDTESDITKLNIVNERLTGGNPFSDDFGNTHASDGVNFDKKPSVVCMTTLGFSITLLIFLAILIISSFLALFFFFKSNCLSAETTKKSKWNLRYF